MFLDSGENHVDSEWFGPITDDFWLQYGKEMATELASFGWKWELATFQSSSFIQSVVRTAADQALNGRYLKLFLLKKKKSNYDGSRKSFSFYEQQKS